MHNFLFFRWFIRWYCLLIFTLSRFDHWELLQIDSFVLITGSHHSLSISKLWNKMLQSQIVPILPQSCNLPVVHGPLLPFNGKWSWRTSLGDMLIATGKPLLLDLVVDKPSTTHVYSGMLVQMYTLHGNAYACAHVRNELSSVPLIPVDPLPLLPFYIWLFHLPWWEPWLPKQSPFALC